jgi:DNA-directed RNA polymerase specialized sigma subunit
LPNKKRKKPSALKKARRTTKVIKKKTLKTSSDAKRDEIAEETEVFLKAGHEINQIPYGVSGLDPMGRGKPTTHGQHKK